MVNLLHNIIFRSAVGLSTFYILKIYNELAQENSVNSNKKKFVTQSDLLKPFDDENGNPIKPHFCHTLASAWLKIQIENSDEDFLSDKNQTLSKLIKTNEEQKIIRQAGKDHTNYAFIATKTAFIQKEVSTADLQTAVGVEKNLAANSFGFLQFPVKPKFSPEGKPGNRHAMAFFNKKDGNCKIFDADYHGGEKSAPCSEIYKFLAARINYYGDIKQDPTYVTLDEIETRKQLQL